MPAKKLYSSFTHLHQPALYANQGIADSVQEWLDDLDGKVLSALARVKEIKSNGEFTIKGKQKAIAAIAAELDREVKKWRKPIDDMLADQIQQLEGKMTPKRNRPNDFIAEMRQAEIRTYLRTLDPIDMEEKYMAAARSGDELFLSAVEESPIPFTFATKGLVDKNRYMRLERQYPEEASKAADLRTAQVDVSSALGSVRGDLQQQGIKILSEDLVGREAA